MDARNKTRFVRMVADLAVCVLLAGCAAKDTCLAMRTKLLHLCPLERIANNQDCREIVRVDVCPSLGWYDQVLTIRQDEKFCTLTVAISNTNLTEAMTRWSRPTGPPPQSVKLLPPVWPSQARVRHYSTTISDEVIRRATSILGRSFQNISKTPRELCGLDGVNYGLEYWKQGQLTAASTWSPSRSTLEGTIVKLSDLLLMYAFFNRYAFYISLRSSFSEVYDGPNHNDTRLKALVQDRLSPWYMNLESFRYGDECHRRSVPFSFDDPKEAKKNLHRWIEEAAATLETQVVDARLAKHVFKVIENRDLNRLEQLLKTEPRHVNAANSFGWTPLFAAVYADQVEAARLLILHGAKVNAKDTANATPLDWALTLERDKIAELLVNHGAEASMFREDPRLRKLKP